MGESESFPDGTPVHHGVDYVARDHKFPTAKGSGTYFRQVQSARKMVLPEIFHFPLCPVHSEGNKATIYE